jgi:hypothetical protein
MIAVNLDNKWLETFYYKEPVIHNIIKEEKTVCLIRKAHIKNMQETIFSDEEVEDIQIDFKHLEHDFSR